AAPRRSFGSAPAFDSGEHADKAVHGLREVESAIEARARGADGILVDPVLVRSLQRAAFYSGLFGVATYYLDRVAVDDEAEHFAQEMADAPEGTAAELKQWVLDRVAVRRGREGAMRLAADMTSFRHIGVEPLMILRWGI